MSDNPLDAMFGGESPAPAPAPEITPEPVAVAPEAAAEATPPPAPETAPERPRAPDGKFAKAGDAAADTRPDPAPPGLIEERRKRQAAEDRAAELERQIAGNTPQKPVPYIDEDVRREITQASLNVRFDMSEEFARQKHTDAVVDQAKAWARDRMAASPAFQAEVIAQRDPYGFVIQQFRRDEIASKVDPDEFARFQAWKAAQTAEPGAATPAITPAVEQPIPPRSIVSQPSAGGSPSKGPIGEGAAYSSLF